MMALFSSVAELNAHPELFLDSSRSDFDNAGPFLHVVDDFYDDPDAIREMALSLDFYQYKPPLSAQVGEIVASKYEDPTPIWFSSALLRYLGQEVNQPQPGYRHATLEIRERLEAIIGETIDHETWYDMGDWWNGAFHLQYASRGPQKRVIHHHYRDGDVAPRGWSGLVYLFPDGSCEYGTSIWREKRTGLCVAGKRNIYDYSHGDYDMALYVENKFNRLVLFRENVLHRAGEGHGHAPQTARLIQTFFFRTTRNR